MSREPSEMDRRQFITASFAAGVGLLVASHGPSGVPGPARAEAGDSEPGGGFAPNAWIRIAEDGAVTVISKTTELGQGITTGLAMIVAEELEADWSLIRTEIAPVDPAYKNPAMGMQGTGGSTGMKTAWEPMRLAAAAVREILIAAAAAGWRVPAAECRAENSRVIHGASGRSAAYKDLLPEAARIEPPQNPRLKQPGRFKIVGKPWPRLDSADKARGRTVYGLDVQLPGLLTAAVVHAPMIGGSPASVKDGKARSMPGVRDVVRLDNAVAVVAESYWKAEQAARVLEIEWQGGDEGLSDQSIMAEYAARAKESGREGRDEGDAEEAYKNAARRLEAVYQLPYQAHACPEPMNCTADVWESGCRIWVPTQGQQTAREVAAHITGLGLEDVQVYTTFAGGGFGRRFMPDFVAEAVSISLAVKAPVKVVWSREEDIRNDLFRPAFYSHVRAGLDAGGKPVAWLQKAVAQSQMANIVDIAAPSFLPGWIPSFLRHPLAGMLSPFIKRSMVPEGELSGSVDMAYEIENTLMEFVQCENPVPVASWRSVGDSCNAFVNESFLDEIAVLTGQDPVDLRLSLLNKAPKHRGALELAADKAGWGAKPPEGVFRGVALHAFHGTPAAMIAEVSVEGKGRVRVHRVVAAVDCGIAVNPNLVRSQIVGGVVFGLTAALVSRIHLEKGRVRESNYHDFPIMTMADAPPVEVHIVQSTDPPGGIGEIGVPPIAPAVTNALFRATGKRIRGIPVLPADLA